MQERTQRSSFNLKAKRCKTPCDSVGGEQRSILVVGFDSFCPLFGITSDETPCATALSELRKFRLSKQQQS
jgi:hypothetical protein